MTNLSLEMLRYPIGKWEKPGSFDNIRVAEEIAVIGNFPEILKLETIDLSDDELNTPYRPGGWTIRQVVHHCADSHMNAFVRFKLALTEEKPTIKTYDESKWSELPDGKSLPVNISLQLLEALHMRWLVLMTSLAKEHWEMSFIHPDHNGELKLFELVSLYAWHCEHHLAHIKLVTEKEKVAGEKK